MLHNDLVVYSGSPVTIELGVVRLNCIRIDGVHCTGATLTSGSLGHPHTDTFPFMAFWDLLMQSRGKVY